MSHSEPHFVKPVYVQARPATAPGLSSDLGHNEHPSSEESSDFSSYSAYVAEFVGTFMLVYIAGAVSIVGNLAWNATAVGFLLIVLVYAFGPVSGGHLNPAVSISLGLLKKCPWEKVGAYVLVQLVAGLLAGFFLSAAFSTGIVFGPVSPLTWGSLFLELIYTAMLCFVFLSCMASTCHNPPEDQNSFFGLAIGFVVIAGGYAAGGISGASFNPAISVGLACTSFRMSISWGLVYSVAEILGGMLAVLLFHLCHPEDFAVHSRYLAPGSLSLCLLSESLGTFILVLTVGLNLATNTGATAWSAGAAVISMVYSLGGVSGAHFNPAVTCGVVLSGRQQCPPMRGLAYAAVQIAAGVFAGFIFQHYQSLATTQNPEHVFGLAPAEATLGGWSVTIVELVFTFSLVYVFLSCATTTLRSSPTGGNFYYALAIGFCLASGIFTVGAISGGALNPAVAFGVSTGSHLSWRWGFANAAPSPWLYCLWFTVIELAAGALAAVAFQCTHTREFQGKSF